jgi:cytochrome c oxidase assembly protein Cox11
MAEDRELEAIRTITLSYTFFPVSAERQPVAQVSGDETGKSM